VRVPAPLEEPLSYPGERPRAPFLLQGDVVSALPPEFDLAGRRAVLAIGSNACPAQLAEKFRERDCSDVVPGLIVDVDALVVRPSAHFSRSGYWPFAPARLDGATGEFVLTPLDDDQVAVLDRTEPNYERVALDPTVHRVGLGRAPYDGNVEVYVSHHGVVDDGRLPNWDDPPPSQHALLAALLRIVANEPPSEDLPAGDVEGLSDAVRRRSERAEDVTRAIRRTLRVRPAALATQANPAQDERRSDRLAMPSANER
jgi:hypothetical protein